MANKADLIGRVAEKQGVSNNQATKNVNEVLEAIMDLTNDEGRLGLAKFGTYEVRERAERKGRNLQTGEEIQIPATKVPTFHPAKEFKNRVKK